MASDQLITPTYASSLATAVIALAEGGERGIFHTAGPRILGRLEFAAMAASAYGLPRQPIRPCSLRSWVWRRPGRYVAD